MRFRLICISFLLNYIFYSCGLSDAEHPGNLVPPTADEDPDLPQLKIDVAGKERVVHLQTFGHPENPPLFVLPGGPGADFRLLLPLQIFSDRYFVVMWDSRGAGLSERVTEEELTISSFPDEVEAIRSALAPGEKLTLCGHSFGAGVMAYYTSKYPENVEQLILIEPGPLTGEGRKNYNGGEIGSFAVVEDFFWQNEFLTSKDHAAADYKAITVLPEVNRTFSCSGEIPEDPVWRFGAFHHHVLTHTEKAPGKNFTWGIEELSRFESEILLIAGSCGAAGAGFQTQFNLPHLPGARLEEIEGAGHMSLFTDFSADLIGGIRNYLIEYQKEQ